MLWKMRKHVYVISNTFLVKSSAVHRTKDFYQLSQKYGVENKNSECINYMVKTSISYFFRCFSFLSHKTKNKTRITVVISISEFADIYSEIRRLHVRSV
jgi:hypothetical protein